ncbi:radical SAM protein [Pelomyxa schiedti]|nr:radical SAM protein [Pelomyxa schiedti]
MAQPAGAPAENAPQQASPCGIVIIGGPSDGGQDTIGGPAKQILTVDGYDASVTFLREYFTNGRNAAAANLKCVSRGYPSLAAVYLKQKLIRERGLESHIIHQYVPDTIPEFEQYVRSCKIMLLSTSMMFGPFVDRVCEHAKRINPAITIIAGGLLIYKSYLIKKLIETGKLPDRLYALAWHPMLKPRKADVDFVVVNRNGEFTLLKLLDSLAKGMEEWRTMDNVYWYNAETTSFVTNPVVEETISDVEVDWSQEPFPHPEWYLFPVRSGQGCPYRCGFCDHYVVEPSMYQCSIDSVIRTLRTVPLVNGYRHVWFTNDNILLGRTQSKKLLQALIDADLHLKWNSFIRVDAIQDEDVADLVAASGCERLNIGVESADATILNNIDKHCTPEMVHRIFQLLIPRGIAVVVLLLIGFPGETMESFHRTIEMVNAIPEGVVQLKAFPLGVLALAPISQQRAKWNLVGVGLDWKHSTMDSITAIKLCNDALDLVRPSVTQLHVHDGECTWDHTKMAKFLTARNILRMRQKGAHENPPDPRTDAELWCCIEENIN